MNREPELFCPLFPRRIKNLPEAVDHGCYDRFAAHLFGEIVSFRKQVAFESFSGYAVFVSQAGIGCCLDKTGTPGKTGLSHEIGNLVDITAFRNGEFI